MISYKPYWVKKVKQKRLVAECQIVRALSKHPFVKVAAQYKVRFTHNNEWIEALFVNNQKEMSFTRTILIKNDDFLLTVRTNCNTIISCLESQQIRIDVCDYNLYVSLRVDREWYGICMDSDCGCDMSDRWRTLTAPQITPLVLENVPQNIPKDISKVIYKMTLEINCSALRQIVQTNVPLRAKAAVESWYYTDVRSTFLAMTCNIYMSKTKDEKRMNTIHLFRYLQNERTPEIWLGILNTLYKHLEKDLADYYTNIIFKL